MRDIRHKTIELTTVTIWSMVSVGKVKGYCVPYAW